MTSLASLVHSSRESFEVHLVRPFLMARPSDGDEQRVRRADRLCVTREVLRLGLEEAQCKDEDGDERRHCRLGVDVPVSRRHGVVGGALASEKEL